MIDKEAIYKEFKKENIERRLSFWHDLCTETVNHSGLPEESYNVHAGLIARMVLSYYRDISRLKSFHDIKKINTAKRMAYSAFWFLRTSPIQVRAPYVPNDGERIFENQLFINETAVARYFTSQLVSYTGKTFSVEIGNHYLDELEYHFKFRFYSPQSLESHIIAFLVGSGCNPFDESHEENDDIKKC